MRILLIPIERAEPGVRSGDWHAAIYHLLSQNHEVVGVERPRWHKTAGTTKGVGIAAYHWMRAFAYGLRHAKDYDVMYCINTPSAFVGLMLHRITGKPFVWDAGNPSLFNPGKGQQRAFRMERAIAKQAGGIRMISRHYLETYADHGFDKAKMAVIPHLVDLDSIDAVKPKEGLGRFAFFMGQGNTPSNMAALRWLDGYLARFVDARIIVSGMSIDGCDRLTFAGYVPDIYEYVKAASVGVVPIWKDSKAPVPSTRTFDFMACGRPVVVTDYLLEAIPELRDGHNAYIARTEGEFVRKVRSALENADGATVLIGKNARHLVEEEYSWKSGIPKLESLLRRAAA